MFMSTRFEGIGHFKADPINWCGTHDSVDPLRTEGVRHNAHPRAEATLDTSADSIRALVRDGEVHSSVYTDEDVFRLEMDRLFHSSWLFVGHESQIAQPGDYITGRLGATPVVCVRSEEGAIHVFVNRCPHRGAQVCLGSGGNTTRLVCPYHGWTFDLRGQISWIPLREEYAQAACDRLAGLDRVGASETYRGFIFACLKKPSSPLGEFLGHFKTVIDDLVDRAPGGSVRAIPHLIRHKYQANWKLTFENLNDTLHARVAHNAGAHAARTVHLSLEEGRTNPILGMMIANAKPLSAFQELTLVTEVGGHSYFGAHMPTGYGEAQSTYAQALARAKGAEEARRILGVERHVAILYPGSSWHARYQTVRIIQPLAPDLTEVIGFVFQLEGAPDAVLHSALDYCNGSTSAFSTIITDDLEIYEGIQRSARDAPAWLQISRQYEPRSREPGTGSYPATSEAYIRNQYVKWVDAMTESAQ